MSSDHSSASALSRMVRALLVVFWPLMIVSAGMATLSLLLRLVHISGTLAAVIGFIGFLTGSIAIASQAVTVRERHWVLASAALLFATAIMFALQVSMAVPNALFISVVVMTVSFYVVAVVRRDAR